MSKFKIEYAVKFLGDLASPDTWYGRGGTEADTFEEAQLFTTLKVAKKKGNFHGGWVHPWGYKIEDTSGATEY